MSRKSESETSFGTNTFLRTLKSSFIILFFLKGGFQKWPNNWLRCVLLSYVCVGVHLCMWGVYTCGHNVPCLARQNQGHNCLACHHGNTILESFYWTKCTWKWAALVYHYCQHTYILDFTRHMDPQKLHTHQVWQANNAYCDGPLTLSTTLTCGWQRLVGEVSALTKMHRKIDA